ncbi:MAG TPA: hypothetical protein VFM93_10735 [Candidatus Limnocylindria bacterium]|nr:hypothetical protein [Candidatus Limnocylindria bacterium]
MAGRTVAALLGLAAAAVLVVAVLAGRTTVDVAVPSPSASPEASPTAPPRASPSPSPAASPSPSPTAGVLSDRYGYVLPDHGRLIVRAETADRPVGSVDGWTGAAVSPDGRRIAVWQPSRTGDGPERLVVVDVATRAERELLTAAAVMRGGSIAWANDGTGLFYSVHSRESVVGAGPRVSELHSYDLAAARAPGATEPELRRSDGFAFVPVGWDKAAQVAFAVVTGEGGFAAEYLVWDKRSLPAGQPAVRRAGVPWPVLFSTVFASPDGKTVLAVDLAANALRLWPASNIAQAATVQRGPARIYDARWRPDSRDIVWVLGPEVRLTTYQTDAERVVYRGEEQMTIAAVRPDGSAALVRRGGRVVVVELAGGRTADLPYAEHLLPHGVALR